MLTCCDHPVSAALTMPRQQSAQLQTTWWSSSSEATTARPVSSDTATACTSIWGACWGFSLTRGAVQSKCEYCHISHDVVAQHGQTGTHLKCQHLPAICGLGQVQRGVS